MATCIFAKIARCRGYIRGGGTKFIFLPTSLVADLGYRLKGCTLRGEVKLTMAAQFRGDINSCDDSNGPARLQDVSFTGACRCSSLMSVGLQVEWDHQKIRCRLGDIEK